MKKITLLILFGLLSSIVHAQNVNIPDVNFKNALLAHGRTISGTGLIDTDLNGRISVYEAQNYTGVINVKNKNIIDLTGIETFVNITELECQQNGLSSINVSANTALTKLWLYDNPISSLDVSTNTALTSLHIDRTQFTSIDLSLNTSLRELFCRVTQLTDLDLSSNGNLTTLYVENNYSIATVNLANGNNTAITTMQARGNSSLTCIQHDTGFTPPSSWQKDSGATYSANCSASSCTNIVNIPDANFKAALLDHGVGITGTGISVIDTDGDGKICTTEASAYTGTINVGNKNIRDLTGIEHFVNITKLDCSGNSLSSLNISANTALTKLNCSGNSLSSLNVSANTALTELICNNNTLSSLDVSANTALTILSCYTNPLNTLNVSANILLTELYCSDNSLSSLDVSVNTALTRLWCSQNSLSSLDVRTNTSLTRLDCYINSLSSLDVSANTALTELYCFNNSLISLNVSANTALTRLDCSNNSLSGLNIANGNNTNMTSMVASGNTNLTCIQTDSNIVGTTPSGWRKDATASYSTNCNNTTYTLTANATNGTVTANPLPTNGSYASGTVVTLTAAANSGYTFANWSGDASGTNATTTVTMNANKTVTASFTQNSTCVVNISDANFKNALLAHGTTITGRDISVIDTNNDGEIQCTEATAYTGVINVATKNIVNLTGIEAFVNITELYCDDNQLTSLDVSANTKLTYINCRLNQLTSLSLGNNTVIDFIVANNNKLTNLDLSANTALRRLYVDTNRLTSLNIANGSNAQFSVMYANGNPSLTCIQIDASFTPPAAWRKDATANWSTNCGAPDTVAPTVATQNITVQLDASGNATITPQQVNNGSSDDRDAASSLTFALNKTTFDCSNIGANTVTLTVTDTSNNSANATATVTVQDTTQPAVVSQNITVQLDASGNATITPQQVDNGSSDNCSIASMSLDTTSFTCANTGANQVVLTVVDANGNSNTANATVTVEDSIVPTAVAQDISVQLGANNQVTITPSQINNGSSDNCTSATNLTYSLDTTTFSCSEVGVNTVTLTVEDASGNQGTATAVVTVTANPTAPLAAVAQNITVQLDANGSVTIQPSDVDNGSGSGCNSNPTLSLDKTTFDCSNVGANTVTLTATDNGNSISATATVMVQDTTQPAVVAQDITVQLDANGQATISTTDIDNGSSDNCSIASMSLDKTTFDCSNVGTNQVVLTVVDANGNSNTATATVTVEDTTVPTAVAQNISVQLGSNNQVTITPQQVDNGSTDNCSIASMSLDKTNFTCSDVGTNTVTLTVEDASGNQSTATAVVTVTANPNAPLAAVAQNITVQLDANGSVTIQPSDVNNGSGSGCNSNPTLSLDKTTFDCSNIGANTVILTATDGGATETATAIVTVEDTMMPTVVTKDITVTLNNGQGTIAVSDIDDNSTDNCSVASTSLDKTSFTCSDLGANTVTLTVTDGQGNVATKTAVVTVVETVVPTVITQNITVALDANGAATITPQQIDNGSSDACSGIASMSLDTISFQCPMLGDQTVTLTVTDNSGNSATGTAIVTFTAPDEDNDGVSDACDSKEVVFNKGFSPNGDGLNDTWVIENIDNYPKNTVEIFNRWGDKVYQVSNYQNNWDGKANQKGGSSEKLPVGQYLYIIKLNEPDTKPIQGWLYINY